MHALQNGLRVERVGGGNATMPCDGAAPIPETADILAFARGADAMLRRHPPRSALAIAARLREGLGVGGGPDFDPARLDRSVWDAVGRGRDAALARLVATGPEEHGRPGPSGWLPSPARLGAFGDDQQFRALAALKAMAALPPEEAIYMAFGERLDGGRAWRLRFASSALPPAQAFWSISAYARDAQGRLSLVANPIGRHAIGDRTPDLSFAPDGSLTLALSHSPPTDGTPAANWLPVPRGPFALILRAYRPWLEALDGRWIPPRPEAVGVP